MPKKNPKIFRWLCFILLQCFGNTRTLIMTLFHFEWEKRGERRPLAGVPCWEAPCSQRAISHLLFVFSHLFCFHLPRFLCFLPQNCPWTIFSRGFWSGFIGFIREEASSVPFAHISQLEESKSLWPLLKRDFGAAAAAVGESELSVRERTRPTLRSESRCGQGLFFQQHQCQPFMPTLSWRSLDQGADALVPLPSVSALIWIIKLSCCVKELEFPFPIWHKHRKNCVTQDWVNSFV